MIPPSPFHRAAPQYSLPPGGALPGPPSPAPPAIPAEAPPPLPPTRRAVRPPIGRGPSPPPAKPPLIQKPSRLIPSAQPPPEEPPQPTPEPEPEPVHTTPAVSSQTVAVTFSRLPPEKASVSALQPTNLPPRLATVLQERRAAAEVAARVGTQRPVWLASIPAKTAQQAPLSALEASYVYVATRISAQSSGADTEAATTRTAGGILADIRAAPLNAIAPALAHVHLSSATAPAPRPSWISRKSLFWEVPSEAPVSQRATKHRETEPAAPKVWPSIPLHSPSAGEAWPAGCRFLVLWGRGSGLDKGQKYHAEQQLHNIRSSAVFTRYFGPQLGAATVQGVVPVDKTEPPGVLRASSNKVPDGGQLFYNSLFCATLKAEGQSWRPVRTGVPSETGTHLSSAPASMVVDERAVWTAIVEFEGEADARDFYAANLFSSATDTFCTRVWALPDFNGIRFWLHSVCTGSVTWPLAVSKTQLEAPAFDQLYLPFLKAGAQIPGLILSALPPPALGVSASIENLQVMLLPWKQPGVAPPALLVASELVGFAVTHLGASPSDLSAVPWVRAPRYMWRCWPGIEGGGDSKRRRLDESSAGASRPSGTASVPLVTPNRLHCVRVALLLYCGGSQGTPCLTPAVCGSRAELLSGDPPTVQVHGGSTGSKTGQAELPRKPLSRVEAAGIPQTSGATGRGAHHSVDTASSNDPRGSVPTGRPARRQVRGNRPSGRRQSAGTTDGGGSNTGASERPQRGPRRAIVRD